MTSLSGMFFPEKSTVELQKFLVQAACNTKQIRPVPSEAILSYPSAY